MKTGILFDLDGTLLDTLDDLTDATNHILRRFGCPERTRAEIRHFVGNGAKRQLEQAFPAGTDLVPVLTAYKSYYSDHCCVKTKPYDGILPALETLNRKFPAAIVSNKPDAAVKELCQLYFPGVYALGETAAIPRKPAPDMVYAAMRDIGVERCIYVGDSEVDVLTAKNAGVPCLSVLWGFRDREEIVQAGGAHFCDAPDQLVSMLEEMLSEF